MNPSVFIISAPSGSGKTTLVERLLREVPGLHFSISYTTRAPRGQEQNGREYFFVTRQEFESMLRAEELLEWAEVFGNYYGTARRFLREAQSRSSDLLLDIDIQGAAQVKEKLPDAVSVFILPPSRDILEYRLRNRSQDAEEVIEKRLNNAKREIFGYSKYDYVLVNDQLDRSASCLRAIVLSERLRRAAGAGNGAALPQEDSAALDALAEACRTERVQGQIQPIIASFTK